MDRFKRLYDKYYPSVFSFFIRRFRFSREEAQDLAQDVFLRVYEFGDDFHAEKITFRNTSGDHGQALALRIDGDRAVLKGCRMLGWQDTLMINVGRHYFEWRYR